MAFQGVSLAALTHSDVHSLLSVITVRLGERNFIKWRFQFQATLSGNGLFGYYDGTEVSPPRYALNTEGEAINEETADYKAWKQTDMALLCLLMATLDEDIVDVIIGCKTSRQAWLAIRHRFCTISRVSIEDKETPLTFRDLGTHLLAAERQIEGNFSFHSNMSTMVTRGDGTRSGERDGASRGWNSRGDGGKGKEAKQSGSGFECQNPKYKPQQATQQQQNRLSSNGPLVECQICLKKGHTVVYCFHRTDVPTDHPSLTIPTCQICGLKGHIALNCTHRTNFAYQGSILSVPQSMSSLVDPAPFFPFSVSCTTLSPAMPIPGAVVHLSQLPTELMGDHNSDAVVSTISDDYASTNGENDINSHVVTGEDDTMQCVNADLNVTIQDAYVDSNESHDSNVGDQADNSNADNNGGQNSEEYVGGASAGFNAKDNDVTHCDINGLSSSRRPIVLANGSNAPVLVQGSLASVENLRSLILSGDFFLESVVACKLTKPVLRLEDVLPSKVEVNKATTQAPLIMVSMLQLSQSSISPHPIDNDSHDRIILCIRMLCNKGEEVKRIWLQSCRQSFVKMLKAKKHWEPEETRAMAHISNALPGGLVDFYHRKSKRSLSLLELEDKVRDDLKHATGEFVEYGDDTNKLNCILLLTGFSDAVYAEAYVTVNHNIVLDVTIINRTKGTLQILCFPSPIFRTHCANLRLATLPEIEGEC
ncbi:hypothetical protein M0R45_023918 [Rubus argutus]|uniref:Coatomer beta subunit C-terminal domain-containing protein n=1 Tax=Rubus argutus TaxID=59490 RepID=A0AAW1WP48_RUBAR